MNITEVEFIASNEYVYIIPNFSVGVIHFITESVGPFRAGIPIKVPVWLAQFLQTQKQCSCVEPTWLDADEMKQLAIDEKNMQQCMNLPDEFLVIKTQTVLSKKLEQNGLKEYALELHDLRSAKIRRYTDICLNTAVTQTINTIQNVAFYESLMIRAIDLMAFSVMKFLLNN